MAGGVGAEHTHLVLFNNTHHTLSFACCSPCALQHTTRPFLPARSPLPPPTGTIDLSGPAWARVSPAARRVVAAMLTRDPAQRPSARQLLRQHDWFYEAAAAAGVKEEEGTEAGAEEGAEERTELRAEAGAEEEATKGTEEEATKGTAAQVEGQAGLEGGECGG